VGQAVFALHPAAAGAGDETTHVPAVVSRADNKKARYSVQFADGSEADGLSVANLRVQVTGLAPSRGPCDANSGCAKSKCSRATDGSVNCMCKCHTASRPAGRAGSQ
jgi:hypothetical protein